LKRPNTEEASIENDGEDWADLAREERMAKKVRRGDVTQAMFDEEFCS
jgi:ATP-dependent RNA helicase DDX55/SPB4